MIYMIFKVLRKSHWHRYWRSADLGAISTTFWRLRVLIWVCDSVQCPRINCIHCIQWLIVSAQVSLRAYRVSGGWEATQLQLVAADLWLNFKPTYEWFWFRPIKLPPGDHQTLLIRDCSALVHFNTESCVRVERFANWLIRHAGQLTEYLLWSWMSCIPQHFLMSSSKWLQWLQWLQWPSHAAASKVALRSEGRQSCSFQTWGVEEVGCRWLQNVALVGRLNPHPDQSDCWQWSPGTFQSRRGPREGYGGFGFLD